MNDLFEMLEFSEISENDEVVPISTSFFFLKWSLILIIKYMNGKLVFSSMCTVKALNCLLLKHPIKISFKLAFYLSKQLVTNRYILHTTNRYITYIFYRLRFSYFQNTNKYSFQNKSIDAVFKTWDQTNIFCLWFIGCICLKNYIIVGIMIEDVYQSWIRYCRIIVNIFHVLFWSCSHYLMFWRIPND